MRKFSWHIPLISSVMENKPTSLSIVGSLAVHFTLVSLDLPSWRCPLRYGLNIPCPGCGLSRAILLLCKGNWQQALKIHAFAPIALTAIALIIITVNYLMTRVYGGEFLELFVVYTPLFGVGKM